MGVNVAEMKGDVNVGVNVGVNVVDGHINQISLDQLKRDNHPRNQSKVCKIFHPGVGVNVGVNVAEMKGGVNVGVNVLT